jgi:flavin reductase (DIM6/NTAB) family NADH-FMN oxidoreductase RutF
MSVNIPPGTNKNWIMLKKLSFFMKATLKASDLLCGINGTSKNPPAP